MENRKESDGMNCDFPYSSEFQKGFSVFAERNTEAGKKSVQSLEEKPVRRVAQLQKDSSVKADILCKNHTQKDVDRCRRHHHDREFGYRGH